MGTTGTGGTGQQPRPATNRLTSKIIFCSDERKSLKQKAEKHTTSRHHGTETPKHMKSETKSHTHKTQKKTITYPHPPTHTETYSQEDSQEWSRDKVFPKRPEIFCKRWIFGDDFSGSNEVRSFTCYIFVSTCLFLRFWAFLTTEIQNFLQP